MAIGLGSIGQYVGDDWNVLTFTKKQQAFFQKCVEQGYYVHSPVNENLFGDERKKNQPGDVTFSIATLGKDSQPSYGIVYQPETKTSYFQLEDPKSVPQKRVEIEKLFQEYQAKGVDCEALLRSIPVWRQNEPEKHHLAASPEFEFYVWERQVGIEKYYERQLHSLRAQGYTRELILASISTWRTVEEYQRTILVLEGFEAYVKNHLEIAKDFSGVEAFVYHRPDHVCQTTSQYVLDALKSAVALPLPANSEREEELKANLVDSTLKFLYDASFSSTCQRGQATIFIVLARALFLERVHAKLSAR